MAVWRHRVFGKYQFSSVQFSHSAMSWLCNLMNFSMPGLPVHHLSRSLLKFTSIKSAMLSYHLILCLSLILLPSIFPSIKVFSKESVLHIMGPKYWSFSISPCNEYSGLISLSIGCFFFSLQSKGLSRVFSNTIVQKHQFFSTQLSIWSKSPINTLLLEKP